MSQHFTMNWVHDSQTTEFQTMRIALVKSNLDNFIKGIVHGTLYASIEDQDRGSRSRSYMNS